MEKKLSECFDGVMEFYTNRLFYKALFVLTLLSEILYASVAFITKGLYGVMLPTGILLLIPAIPFVMTGITFGIFGFRFLMCKIFRF